MGHVRRVLTVLLIIGVTLALLVAPARAGGGRQFLPLVYHRPPARRFPGALSQPYIVQPGDTLFRLAVRFQRPLHQMLCALPWNQDAGEPLRAGERVWIPPRASVCHVASEGQTLSVLARAYGSAVGDIIAQPQNGLSRPPYTVMPGRRVLIPTARPMAPWPYGDGHFRWPLRGPITQEWRDDHPALDIAAAADTPVVAADTGRVAWAGWDFTGYGWLVILDHGNGYRTYYAHLHTIWVARDEVVLKGQPLGTVGSTGRSTGPHLHFEIRDYGRRVNPMTLLPAAPESNGPPNRPSPQH